MTGFLTAFRHRLLRRPARRIKKVLPKSLFGRTLLIIVVPTILALAVATFVFFNRHWYTTTHRLTHAVAGDIGTFVALLEERPEKSEKDLVYALAFRKLDLEIGFQPGEALTARKDGFVTPLEDMLRRALDERVSFPFGIDMRARKGYFAVFVQAPDGLYTFTIPERRIYTPTTEVFIGWMIGSSVLLSVIALLFMRNQVRPVRRLAQAAEAIGRGQDAPWFKPEGAAEVRQASAALMVMRDRLRRAMGQRTAMLAGVSHDLRTPLTRLKLQLEMMPKDAQTRGFRADIREMEDMLEAYLAFARSDEPEATKQTDLAALVKEIVEAARRENPSVALTVSGTIETTLRPCAIKRCIGNLVSNALRYGKSAEVSLSERDNSVDIFVDDDGPGIPENRREDVFKPFLRLDESRNMETGGVGLGLTIARDIARAHGGDIILSESPRGGLRAHVWLPI